MKKLLIISFVLLLFVTTPALSHSISYTSSSDTTINDDQGKNEENNFALRVCVIAIPKIFLHGKFVFFKVMFPRFLIEGYVDYAFSDETYQTGDNYLKHKFLSSGIYQVTVEFDTIFGIAATGSTRVLIL